MSLQIRTRPQLTYHDHKCMVLTSLKLTKYQGFYSVLPKGLAIEHPFSPFFDRKDRILFNLLFVGCPFCYVEHANVKVWHQDGPIHPSFPCTAGSIGHKIHTCPVILTSVHRISSVHLHTLLKTHTPGPAQLCSSSFSIYVKDSTCT